MDPLPIRLARTQALADFKCLLGQANHLVITILIGLDAVESGLATRSDSFHTSWDPRNSVESAKRSRAFALSSLTSRVYDALDAYEYSLRRFPDAASPVVDVRETDGLWPRFEELSTRLCLGYSVNKDMTEMALRWRNKIVHHNASTKMGAQLRARLLEGADLIAAEFQGLDVRRSIENFEKGKMSAPTFKEATAFVRAAERFVYAIDEGVVRATNPEAVLIEALREYVRVDPVNRPARVWGKDLESRRSSIVQIALTAGMAPANGFDGLRSVALEEVLAWTPREARRALAASTT